MEEKISLLDLVQKCLDFRGSPWNEDIYNDITRTVAAIDFRERLTLAEKAVVAMTTIAKVDSMDLNPVECAFQLETALFFNGLCLYMINVENDLPPSIQTMETYDLLTTFGLEDRALEFCKNDFEKLRRMVDDACNFSNIFRLIKAAKDFSPEGVDKLKEVLEGLRTELTPERIKEIRGLMVDADPAWKSLKETVGEDIVENKLLSEAAALGDSLKAEDAAPEEAPEKEPEPGDIPEKMKPFGGEEGGKKDPNE